MGSPIWFDIEKPVQVITPLSRSVSNLVIERVGEYARYSDVSMILALGSDAVVFYGREEDVLDTICFALEEALCMFHTVPGDA